MDSESEATAVPILNREFQLPADGWYQIAPLGEFPHAAAGVVQVIDRVAVDHMVNAFRRDSKHKGFGGVLVDYDHFSLSNDTPSKAAGWVTEMRARDDGLWGRIRWSKTGKEAVEGGEYRYLSPVWNREDCEDLDDGKVRPLRLRNAAVTNEPNLRGIAPLSNRAQVESRATGTVEHEETLSATGKDGMKDIAKAAGLAEDAPKEKILEHVQQLAASAAEVPTLRNRIQEFETAALNAQIEKDLDEHKDVISNRDEARKALQANREPTLAAWKLLKKPEQTKTIPNRADGTTPPEGQSGAGDRRKMVEDIRNRECARGKPISFEAAWRIAEREHPDTFRKE